MPCSPAQLEARLQQPLPAVILLAGSEALLRLEAADAVRAAARSQGYAEREVFEADASFNWDQLAGAFASLSLFASRRLLDLRLPSGKPGKEGAELIERYCASLPPDLCLLISAEDWSKKHELAWVRAVDRAGLWVTFWPIRQDQLGAWVARRLRARGVKADAEAVAVLVERTEGNLLATAQEVDKLALLASGRTLDAAAMQSLVLDSARFDVFGMTEAALAGDAARALRMLRGLRGEGEMIVPLMNWLTGQLQLLGVLADAEATGASVEAALQKAGIWESRRSAYRQALARHGVAGCQRLLGVGAELDRASKGRSNQDPWVLIERILVALAERRARMLLG